VEVKAEQGSRGFSVEFCFHGDLPVFLKPRGTRSLIRTLREKTSVKDAIEGCGVPHVEVDLILWNGGVVPFEHHLEAEGFVEVYGAGSVPAEFSHHTLQRRNAVRFVADGHVEKMARHLRLLGVDVMYAADASDEELATIADEEERALLTRDRRLLMRSVIRDGYWLRSQVPEEQAAEVTERFGLADKLQPFTRCSQCNGLLQQVEKGRSSSSWSR
jgi:hypothetical protein